MADFFGQETTVGPSFKANLASFTFGSQSLVGLVVQNFGADYQQQVTRIWELGNAGRSYYVVGRSSGQLQLSRVVGPPVVGTDFRATFANACNVASNNLTITASSGMCVDGSATTSGSTQRRSMNGCLLTGVGMQVAAADMLIQDRMQGMFMSMSEDNS